ncbi:MAG: hypothetical protein Q8Q67_01950 [bacterium]|nr:hypothetical protein [bacterium]
MKFTAIVIMKSDTAVLDNIRKKINDKGKEYLSAEMKNNFSLLFDMDPHDDKALAEKLAEINQTETGVDEKGIYQLSYVYKEALVEQCQRKIDKPLKQLNFFDDYDIFDLMLTDDLVNAVDGYDRFPHAIVTPELKLIQPPTGFMHVDVSSPNYKDYIKWTKDFKEMLKQYSTNSFALILGCHG